MRRSTLALASRAGRSVTCYPAGWVPTGSDSPPAAGGWSLCAASASTSSAASTSTGAWAAPTPPRAWAGPTFASSYATTTTTTSTPSPFAAQEQQQRSPPSPPPPPPPPLLPDASIAESLEAVNALFVEARDELEYAAEDAGTVWAGESYETAASAVAAAADAYARLLAALPPDEAGRVSRGMGMKMQQLQAELEAVDPAGAAGH